MTRALPTLLFLLCLAPVCSALLAQGSDGPRYRYTERDPLADVAGDGWLRPADTFHADRFYTAAAIGASTYAGFGVGLYSIWYKGYELERFHTFNDWPEWEQMDKAGHAFTAYAFNRMAFAGLRWTGLKRPAARYTALGVANLLQATIETMDGFSANWGFSLGDMGANLAGSLVFTAQDALWQEQRMLLKVSNDFRPPPDVPLYGRNGVEGNLGYVSRMRFGENPFERYLKDYNAQTIWLSVNPAAFAPRSFLPPWLNLAVGYGVEDVYGAYYNTWRQDGAGFSYRNDDRRRQWFLSPDLYLSRIPTNKRWVRMVLGILDFVKVPSPALEYSRGRFYGHWIM
ncbi:hypothetical protein GGR26_002312 [Lewinella marina]|uniref:DUF2279 domain-containing protein n=1 Tax=Neolewinella marina TaxID=438751 RepID=A0A2G0CGA6_9BACT|nr:DUF2279 domain-containing protein [Neolewinella marina]NJB86544.1 hypothetical protein [Neolewinella marina]PHK99002.1 DUF2279 domain-containing protein [Neolewinella marina]